MKTKENYIAPELTVVTYKVEQGFTASGNGMQSLISLFCIQAEPEYNSHAQENWQEENSIFENW